MTRRSIVLTFPGLMPGTANNIIADLFREQPAPVLPMSADTTVDLTIPHTASTEQFEALIEHLQKQFPDVEVRYSE